MRGDIARAWDYRYPPSTLRPPVQHVHSCTTAAYHVSDRVSAAPADYTALHHCIVVLVAAHPVSTSKFPRGLQNKEQPHADSKTTTNDLHLLAARVDYASGGAEQRPGSIGRAVFS